MSALVEHLARQERAVASKIGAGLDVAKAHDLNRWVNELSADVGASRDASTQVMELLHSDITKAVGPIQDRAGRASAVHAIYGFYVEKARHDGLSTAQQTGKHMVYLLHDANSVLLYVGITDRGPVRLVEHYRHKPWFSQVCRVEFERYETRTASEAREKSLITKRAPLHNIQHNHGRQVA